MSKKCNTMKTEDVCSMMTTAAFVLPLGNNTFCITWINGNQTRIKILEARHKNLRPEEKER